MEDKQPEIEKSGNQAGSLSDSEKGPKQTNYIPQSDEEYNVTFKTWIVVAILSFSYGISFWIIPTLSACVAQVATQLGDVSAQAFFLPIYTLTITIAFMVCGANSDLFGRRWFIIFGNVLLFIGFILGGRAQNPTQMIAAMAIIGFGAGNAQLAAFAVPELLPNKWRPVAVTLADAGVVFDVIVGPIAGRSAIELSYSGWRWLFYVPAILVVISFTGLFFYYYPPAHPRGLPFKQAIRELDYGGAILFIMSTVLILTGIIYTTTLPSSDPRVLGTLIAGFILLAIFALYETFMPLKQPLTPQHVFTKGGGRELTAPFIAGFVVTMFYYSINIIYPTMIFVFFTDSTTGWRYAMVLTLPQNLGFLLGVLLLVTLGSKIGHYRWTYTAAVTLMVVFGTLLALGRPDRFGMMIAFVFLAEVGFGFAQYLSITFIQFGTKQEELGISGGLAGVARFAGGAVALSVYTTILTNTQTAEAARLIPAAATGAGLPESSVSQLITALSLGASALAEVPGITDSIIAAASTALQQSYVVGLRTTALSSLAFGIVGIIACACCQEISHKMNNKIEIFLENDVNAARNTHH
ncbi:hypothetical protein PFICI_07429 [Pestalotiopsis fici W106-1]|uniref:Major facilitator superfamily (MFS) profile domain-containing protein n=1 Tax=Pestalotiopsis fici (strain W106-1 / CGMCC3.15140) TaxID=1229662 RepID=W3X1E8_PESFW|nr:uncharacterized protein PFICI_07429 [Pestalotiopsis fici W106-1]ETS79900.1 hypothetical protein PFICI_07429 [Pestalotiopsis fici W106-1]